MHSGPAGVTFYFATWPDTIMGVLCKGKRVISRVWLDRNNYLFSHVPMNLDNK